MNRICLDCNKEYDDVRCLTYCPHDPLMPDEDMERKIYALKIFDCKKEVASKKDPNIHGFVTSVGYKGHITLSGFKWDEEFDALDFEVKE